MERLQNVILVLLVCVLVGCGVWYYIRHIQNQSGYIAVTSSVVATVYLDGRNVGQTPARLKISREKVNLKVLANANSYKPFETNIFVDPNSEASVDVRFYELGNETVVVYQSKISGNQAQISGLSTPRLAGVKIDGQSRGFSPIKVNSIQPGKHILEFEFTGYIKKSVEIETKAGFMTMVQVSLTQDVNFVATPLPSISPSPEPQQTPNQQMVEIQTTPTGFLRVRADASASSNEIGQAKPGEKYIYLATDDTGEWYKIQFNESNQGWVAVQYAKLIEQ